MNVKRKVAVGLAFMTGAYVIACLFMGPVAVAVVIGVGLAWAGGFLHGRRWFRKPRRTESHEKGVEHERAVSG